MRHQYGFMNAQMRTQTEKLIIQDFYIVILRANPFLLFENCFFSILTHGFSKTHPPQFLNNKHVCIPKYNYYSILLPLHLPIYFLWFSLTLTLFFLSIKKCAYTDIFIQKLALHIQFYFHALYFDIPPTDLQTIMFYRFKNLLFRFIFVYINEAINRIFKTNQNCT